MKASEECAKPVKMNLNLGGQVVQAEKMEFAPIDESWSLYRLEDGTVIRIRLIVSEVFRLPGLDPLTGVPQFLAKSSNVMVVDRPSSPSTQTKKVQ